MSNGPSRRQSLGGAENLPRSSSTGFSSRRVPTSQFGSAPSSNASAVLKHAKSSSRSFDGGSRSLDMNKVYINGIGGNASLNKGVDGNRNSETHSTWKEMDGKHSEAAKSDTEDCVSGVLYDMLQKEVISLRKAGHEKDQSLKDKDDAIEMLAKKVDTLTKAMEVEAKKMRREVAAMEKEVAAMRVNKEHDVRARRLNVEKEVAAMHLNNEHDVRARRLTASKGHVNVSQLLPGRNTRNT